MFIAIAIATATATAIVLVVVIAIVIVILTHALSVARQVMDYLTRFSGLLPGDLDPSTSEHHLIPLKRAYVKLRWGRVVVTSPILPLLCTRKCSPALCSRGK